MLWGVKDPWVRRLLVGAALLAAPIAGGAGAAHADEVPYFHSGPVLSDPVLEGLSLVAHVEAGRWGGAHLQFQYVWQRCDASGAQCAAMSGVEAFTRQSSDDYVVQPADVGFRLRAYPGW